MASDVSGGSEAPTTGGALSPSALPTVLRDLYVGRQTGFLHFTQGQDRRSVRFIKGHIVHGESSVESAQLGPTMVRHGLLNASDLERARHLVVPSQKRLGVVLLELGLLDKDRLEDAVGLHVREILQEAFTWQEGTYAFESQDPDAIPNDDLTLKLSTGETILEAVRSIKDPEVVRHSLGDVDRPLILSTDPLLRFQRVTLTSTDGFVLSRVDGALTVREVVKVTPVAEEEVYRSLAGLLCVGIVEFLPRAPERRAASPPLREAIIEAYQGLESRSDREILGVAALAGPDEVRAAYLAQAKRYHPDLHHDPSLADLRDKLEAIFGRVTLAYENLARVQTKAAGVETPESDAAKAAAALNEAGQRVAEGKHWEAVGILDCAMPALEGVSKRRAQMLLARVHLKSPDRVKTAEELLQAVIREDPGNVEAYSLLGRLYKDLGLTSRATNMFRKVLDLKPEQRQAKVALESLPQSSMPSGGGLFAKLFKKP